MAADHDTQLQELRHTIDLISDRLLTLEQDHERLSRMLARRKPPFLTPAGRVTRWAVALAAGLGLLAVLLIASPTSIDVGPYHYESDGLSAELIAAIPPAIAALIALWSHQKDKEAAARDHRKR